jgi:peroxiredoxin
MFKLNNGDPAPEIVLRDARGEEWRLSDKRGKMVVLHFCRGEF